MNALEALNYACESLKTSGIQDAEKEAELLVTQGLEIERVSLYRDNPPLGWEDPSRLDSMLERRKRHEPIQYILGEVEFYGLRIRVGPGVLIPRPETELLVEEAARRLSGNPRPRILELCTGSGCVALALARAIPSATVIATEKSGEALRYAHENATINGIENAVFLHGSLFEPVAGEHFDAVLANPPYIKTREINSLAPEIRNWEPREALDGGHDGLDFYREIIPKAPRYLLPVGMLILEMGAALAPSVEEIAEGAGLSAEPPVRDWGGCDRAMVIRMRQAI